MTDKDRPEPRIRFGGQWIPAHQAWKRLETAAQAADAIERFNERHPELSSETTREVVPLVRQRLRDIELRMPPREGADPDLARLAGELLRRLPPEEVLEQLRDTRGAALDLPGLIALAGEGAYLDALRAEAREYAANAILPEQTADIWNDMKRPAPGGGLWSRRKVERLLEADQS